MSEQMESSKASSGLSRRDLIVGASGFVVGTVATAAAGRLLAVPPIPRLLEWKPESSVWKKVPVRNLSLTTAPPFHAVIHGTAAHQRLQAQAIGTVEEVYIRVQWEDKGKHDQIRNLTDFSDAVAVQFPQNRNPQTTAIMGTREAPVNIWYWKASSGKAQNLVAEGPFTIVPAPAQDVEAVGEYKDGRWVVTFRRNRKPQDGSSVDLTGMRVMPVAFALWEGVNYEANGLKAVTTEAAQGRWVELEFVEAVS
jgi:DMSO reductase family type II enzyme heme b subunit